MKLWVQLGRAGDIINILPLLHADFVATKEKPQLMIAKEYAPLLDGVSYVEPILFEGSAFELAKAVDLAKIRSKEVVVTQVVGIRAELREHSFRPAGFQGAHATSFQKEQWRLAGALTRWGDLLPLVFDRRDKDRELKLLRDHDLLKAGARGQKPLLVLGLKGNSSPFPYEDLLRELVTLKFGATHRILELPRAERLYDLLAIYERAALLIVVDSAPLHLAWACRKLPVFALVQDRIPVNPSDTPQLKREKRDQSAGGLGNWWGSCWRPNHAWYCRYHDWPNRAMEMVECILTFKDHKNASPSLSVWSEYNTHRKFPVAGHQLPIMRGMCARDSKNTLQDDERHPYLRDVIRMALQRAATESMTIQLTRPFVTIRAGQRFEPKPPYYAYRMQDGGEHFGQTYSPIADLFCATKKWWRDIGSEIPDLIMNNDYTWSECLRVIFQQHGARDETGLCYFGKEPV